MEPNKINDCTTSTEEIILEEYSKLYKELEPHHSLRPNRRFSFSIPDDEPATNESLITPTPPSSPFLAQSISPIMIQIPDSLSLLDEQWDLPDTGTPVSPTTPQNELSGIILISSPEDRTSYKIPSRQSQDARRIWKEAKIHSISFPYDIEKRLLNWASKYAYLEVKNNIVISITWKTKSECKCSSSWRTFLRWMMCASVATV